jgi:hypothetical protein
MSYSCKNDRFHTDDCKGFSHGSFSTNRGSVFPTPLYSGRWGTTWLEHVKDKKNPGDSFYWFMFYDPSGTPPINQSVVLEKAQLEEFARLMASQLPDK